MLETPQVYSGESLEIIAEAACNHKGDINEAFKLCRAAKASGADTIKFQSFVADKLVNPGDILDFCRQSQLSYEQHCAIIEECEVLKINPLFSAFDEQSLDLLHGVGMEIVKIPSGQIYNRKILTRAAEYGMKVYLSTGMCSLTQVEKALADLTCAGMPEDYITLFQCTTCYPAPLEDANLRVLELYRKEFGLKVGYSDHTRGWTAAIGAVALGASVIEKHFILDLQDDTPDACVSLNPVEFSMMSIHLREIEIARGVPVKRPRQCEQKMFKRRDFGGN